jgi:tetratricopeptide (TPR) repeat protein
MKRPYNDGDCEPRSSENAVKLGLLVTVMAFAVIGISCRKAAMAPADRAAARPATEAIAEADQLYGGRADLVKVRQGVVMLRGAQAEDQSNYDLAWRLAKFNYYLGAHTTEATERDKAFHDGIEAGKLAVQLQTGRADGHFWLGANYGGQAQSSVLSGLSGIDDIKHEMETVLKLDEGYQSGSAYMVLGEVYLKAPGMLGGDTQKAIEYLEKGLQFGPGNALLRVHLAEAYAAAHRNDDARKQIEALLAMKPAPGYEPEYNESVVQAKQLQERLK